MIKKIKSLLEKKQKGTPLPPRFALVDFTESAKRMNVGGSRNKVIKIFENSIEVDREPYTDTRIQTLRHIEGIPVEDMTQGTNHPKKEWYHTVNPAAIETHKFRGM